MNGRIARFNRVGVGMLAVLGLALVMSGQEKSPEKRAGLVTDWTSRHLVFSPPSSPEVATKVAQDPRYWQQWARRNMHPMIKGTNGSASEVAEQEAPDAVGLAKKKKTGMEKDWSVEMATTAAMGDLNYAAKYSFSTSAASCSDYVVYNTGVAGNSTTTNATVTGTFTGDPTEVYSTADPHVIIDGSTIYANPGGQVTIEAAPTAGTDTLVVGADTYYWESQAGGSTQCTKTGTNRCVEAETTFGTGATDATNLENAINGTSCYVGTCTANPTVGATVSGNIVTLTFKVNFTSIDYTLVSSNVSNVLPGISPYGSGSTTAGSTSFAIGVDTTSGGSVASREANNAASLAVYVTGDSGTLGVTGTSSGPTVTLTSTTAGPGGDFTQPTSADLTGDFSWATEVDGTTAAASIIAYHNLYTGATGTGGCGGSTAAPPVTVAFAYNTGGTVTTSPVLSLDGTQVAFVQNNGTNEAQLVMLKPSLTSGGTFNGPAAIHTASSAADYSAGCTAEGGLPCVYAITFALDAGGGTAPSDGLAATRSGGSSPWYDYAFDVVYVGDDRGYVHEFTGVFHGNPTEATSPWPIATATTATGNTEPLTSPVFDETHAVLYVGDAGGHEDWINTATGALGASSAAIGKGTNDIYDAPLVDPSIGTAGYVYQTVASDGTNSGVFQFTGKFAASAGGTEESTLPLVSGALIYTGAFDNGYYTAGTGHLIVCGGAATTDRPTLYSIAITTTSGVSTMSSAAAGPTLTSSSAATCSSITEVFNGSTDDVYTSVTNHETGITGCSGGGGCVVAYSESGGTLTYSGATNSAGGTTGIIIDNFATSTGASQVYYSPLSTTPCTNTTGTPTAGCAVQSAQGTL